MTYWKKIQFEVTHTLQVFINFDSREQGGDFKIFFAVFMLSHIIPPSPRNHHFRNQRN